MEWISLKTLNYKQQTRDCWHKWFAWFPVVVKAYPDGAVKKAWLRTVLRIGTWYNGYDGCGWNYSYRELERTVNGKD